MLVNDECSSWYKSRRFLVSIWDRRKQLLYTDGSVCITRQTTPLLRSAWLMALSAITVDECEQFVCLFMKWPHDSQLT